jgi:hypothetical protein
MIHDRYIYCMTPYQLPTLFVAGYDMKVIMNSEFWGMERKQFRPVSKDYLTPSKRHLVKLQIARW